MKLARKLTLAILAVMVAVLALNAVQRVRRDRHAIREDVQRDHRSLGNALRVVVIESFREDGEQRALAVVNAANQRESAIQIEWRWLDENGPLESLALQQRRMLRSGRDLQIVHEVGRTPWLSSYFPARLDDGRMGAISLRESLASEADAVRRTVVHSVISTAAIALLAGMVTAWLGFVLVGRPVAQLSEKARRVGAGDLSGPISATQADELGALAREMNAMCDRLQEAQIARQHALEQLRHAERLATVGRLAAGIAHELGTPLNVVGIEAKRIAVGRAVGADAAEGARVIAEQAQRMAEIMRQLLDFARRRTPKLTAVELGGLAREAAELVGPLAARSGHTFSFEQRGPTEVQVDRGQLMQVLTNILMNAMHAMPAGGEVRIETGSSPARSGDIGRAYVRVVDRGHGIAPENLPRIFEPFFTTKEIGQGTGLGLAVAHGIVEEHGGTIAVESTVGEGSAFTVELPRQQQMEVA